MQLINLLMSLVLLCVEVRGHGRLIEPPSRSSMWRYGFSTPENYDDNQLNCGGFGNQWQRHGGKCGVCGDPWQGQRKNEAGGKYATGTISRSYTQGQQITITVQITANHKGWFEFRLCPVNNMMVKATFKCLNDYLLQLADGSGSQFKIGSENKDYNIEVILPPSLTCSQCVLQWKYHAGNNWGVNADGKGCLGCGPQQEEFYGCADIAINPEGAESTESSTESSTPPSATVETVPTTTAATTTSSPSTVTTTAATTSSDVTSVPSSETCSSETVYAEDVVSNEWCSNNCPTGSCKKILICDKP